MKLQFTATVAECRLENTGAIIHESALSVYAVCSMFIKTWGTYQHSSKSTACNERWNCIETAVSEERIFRQALGRACPVHTPPIHHQTSQLKRKITKEEHDSKRNHHVLAAVAGLPPATDDPPGGEKAEENHHRKVRRTSNLAAFSSVSVEHNNL